jgi:hypothetical protein
MLINGHIIKNMVLQVAREILVIQTGCHRPEKGAGEAPALKDGVHGQEGKIKVLRRSVVVSYSGKEAVDLDIMSDMLPTAA